MTEPDALQTAPSSHDHIAGSNGGHLWPATRSRAAQGEPLGAAGDERSEVAASGSLRDEPVRLLALDGLRGLAIVLVMLFHFVAMPAHSLIDQPLVVLARYGWTGVDLFFVLSGFLITGILLDAKGSKHYYRNFYIRRGLRIWPLYYGFVAALLVVYPWVGGAAGAAEAATLREHQWWVWTHTMNWLVAISGDFTTKATLGTGGFWSLSIEEQFYLAWPLVVAALPPRMLLRSCLVLVLGSLVVRLGMTVLGASWAAVYTATFARVDPLAIGAALAVIARERDGLAGLRRHTGAAIIGAILGFAAIEVILRHVREPNYVLSLALQCSLVALLWSAVLIRTLTAAPGGALARFTHTRVLRSFGKYSYALYLFHGHVNRLFSKIGLDPKGSDAGPGPVLLRQLLYLGLALAVSYAAAFLSWHLYENHFLRLKRFFPSRRPKPVETVAAP